MDRYLLQRADGAFFRHPTNEDVTEWITSHQGAHQWASFEGAKAAAFVWRHLKGEEVKVVPTSFLPATFSQAVATTSEAT